ncbi:hypothetical protein HUU05_20135 [candidate division KSB1 bacterium]|nr:hypothetical protein [candidate division KSB1 bacterium]
MKRTIKHSCTLAVFAIFFMLSSSHAQERECQTALERAEDQYDVSNYSGVIGLLEPCAALLPQERRVRAYKLLALARLKVKERDSAKTDVKELLDLKPKFVPDAGQDSPEFIALVNEVKQEQVRPGSNKKWYWIAGGGLVAGAVAAFLIFKDEGLARLPEAPDPPKR